MRTTIDIPEELIREARLLAGTSSKTATIIYSLQELIRHKKIEKLRSMRGKLEIDIRLDELREDRVNGQAYSD